MSSPILDIKQILHLATLVESLTDSIKEFYAKGFDLQTRRARTKELISEVFVGLTPAVSVLELRNPYAANLLKRRIAVMERDALSCCEKDIPEFTNPQEPRERISDGGKDAGALVVFCRLFAVSVRALATEFSSATSGQLDTNIISAKKSKRRILNEHGKACIKEFKGYQKRGDAQSMLNVVRVYVSEHPEVKESSLYKMLSDHSDQWKP